jgi:antitoxin VapB
MSTERHVKLFRNGRNQAVRIPREFELPGEDAVMRREGDTLVIRAKSKPTTLDEFLDTLEPTDDPFPEIDDPPTKPEDIF